MTKKKRSQPEPSRASLRDIPPIDFAHYGRPRRNPFARRIARDGWALAHDEPSAHSLREVPEVDRTTKGAANPYVERVRAHGSTVRIGRGRPKVGDETGPTTVKSVRLPAATWKRLEAQARARGIALHALVRLAIADWLEGS